MLCFVSVFDLFSAFCWLLVLEKGGRSVFTDLTANVFVLRDGVTGLSCFWLFVYCYFFFFFFLIVLLIAFILWRYSPLSNRLTAPAYDSKRMTCFLIARFSISTEVVYIQCCLVVTWLVPRETAAVSARSLYTIQPCTMSRHFIKSHIRWVHACLTVTCHLYFGQNDRDILRATAVTREWNG